MTDPLYTNGAIAVMEQSLLKDRFLRLVSLSAEEAFRTLTESGFGRGAEAFSAADGERLCLAEEEALMRFVREYAPTEGIKAYFLSPRDFHNAKALVKAKLLGGSAEKLLAPNGLFTAEEISFSLEEGKELCKELSGAAAQCLSSEGITGAEVGAIFDRALYAYLFRTAKRGPLKQLVQGRIDRLNLLTSVRSQGKEGFEARFIGGGTLKKEAFSPVFEEDGEERALENAGALAPFLALLLAARREKRPYTEAERALDSFETEFFAAHRYELEGRDTFLYYVLRKRAEIANVRILLVCLNAGLPEREIQKRLRTV